MRVCKRAYLSLVSVSAPWLAFAGQENKRWSHLLPQFPSTQLGVGPTLTLFDFLPLRLHEGHVQSLLSVLLQEIFPRSQHLQGVFGSLDPALGPHGTLVLSHRGCQPMGQSRAAVARAAVSPTLRGLQVSGLEHPAPQFYFSIAL